jgi:IS5 family transposase
MDALYIVTTYVVLDDSLKQIAFVDDVRVSLTAAEILTVAVVAARYFHNHLERALLVMIQLGYIKPLSVSRFNRRLHQLVGQLGRLSRAVAQRFQAAAVYLVDAFPLPVCQRVRQGRCRKVRGAAFLGRCEAKREWFFGYKLHWCCSAKGVPLAFTLRPARRHEGSAVSVLFAHLPPGATVVGDGAYVSHKRAAFWQQRGIRLVAKRYGRMSPNSPDEQALLRQRQMIETVHSQLESMGLQRLRAHTRAGFCLKVACSLLALSMSHLLPD